MPRQAQNQVWFDSNPLFSNSLSPAVIAVGKGSGKSTVRDWKLCLSGSRRRESGERRDEGKEGAKRKNQEQEEDRMNRVRSVVGTFHLEKVDSKFILRKDKGTDDSTSREVTLAVDMTVLFSEENKYLVKPSVGVFISTVLNFAPRH